ncbi:MAG: RNA polymerase sigma factor [Planctomycetota bacterium]
MTRPSGENEGAFSDLYDRYAPSLFRAAFSLTGATDLAEDAVQDVFISLFQTGHAISEITNMKAYLFTSIRHAAVKRHRIQSHTSLDGVEDTLIDKDAHPVESQWFPDIEKSLQSLPDDQREAIVLKIDGDLTFDELGKALGVNASTAASRYRYGIAKLRERIKDQRHDEI